MPGDCTQKTSKSVKIVVIYAQPKFYCGVNSGNCCLLCDFTSLEGWCYRLKLSPCWIFRTENRHKKFFLVCKGYATHPFLQETFKCENCDKFSAQNSDLKAHIVRAYLQNKQWLRIDRALPHTVPLREFFKCEKCETCDKYSPQHSNLKTHIVRAHLQNIPH